MGAIDQNRIIMKENELLLMEFRMMCYGLMERVIREQEDISCSIRATTKGSFTCVLHYRGGIGGKEIVDSEAQSFYLYDTRREMIEKYDFLTQFLWLNGD